MVEDSLIAIGQFKRSSVFRSRAESQIAAWHNKRSSIFRSNPNKPIRGNFLLVDYFTHADEISTKKFIKLKKGIKSLKFLLAGSNMFNPTYILGLFLLGSSIAITGFFFDLLIQSLQKFHLFLANTGIFGVDFLIFSLYSAILCTVSMYINSFIPASVQESEIAEVKAVISGVKIPYFFSVRTLLLKFFSVSLAIGGGLSMGKEGAFVHIASIISNKILKLKIFRFIYKNSTLRNQFLSASVAAGFTVVFHNSIGAMFFNIEVISSVYIVSNMWKAAFCTLCSSIIYKLLQLSSLIQSIHTTRFPRLDLNIELFFFMLLGILTGLLGVFIIFSSRYLIHLKKQQRWPLIHEKYRYIILISIITSLITFSTPFMRQNDIRVMNNMFKEKISDDDWESGSETLNFFFYFVVKFFLTIITTSIDLPTGIIFPLLACGACWGRLFGVLMESMLEVQKYEEIYAAVGAASLVASTTHSISISIIVFALTGQIDYLVAMIISVFLAYGVSNFFSISFYDSMLEHKEIPYFPLLQPVSSYYLCAKDILSVDFPCLSTESTLQDLIDAIFQASKYIKRIPIIKKNGILLYDISIENAKEYIFAFYQHNRNTYPKDARESLDNVVDYIMKFNSGSFIEIENESLLAHDTVVKTVEIKYFARAKIDVESEILAVDDAPFSVLHSAAYAKVQFLFINLNLSQIYVTRKGMLIGLITRDSFANISRIPIENSEDNF